MYTLFFFSFLSFLRLFLLRFSSALFVFLVVDMIVIYLVLYLWNTSLIEVLV